MNIEKLRQAEANFLNRYPGGFADPGMDHIKKKHNVAKLSDFAREHITRAACSRPEQLAQSLLTVVSRSSMVSRFEKPKFRDFLAALNGHEKQLLALAVEKRLFGRAKAKGFAELVEIMQPHGVAKWPILTAIPFYLQPEKEAFVKPTTAKNIIKYLEVEGLHYSPTPSWEFYRGYRDLLAEVRTAVVPSIATNYAALSGFLMMSAE